MTLRLTLLVALLTVLAAGPARAQAWTQEPGRVYTKLTLGLVSTDTRFDADGGAVPYNPALDDLDETARLDGSPFRDRSLYLYTEFGLGEGLTLVGMLPYKRLFVRDVGGSAATGELEVERAGQDLGNAMMAVRVGLEDRLGLDEASALAFTFGLRVPLGYRRNLAPAVGSGQADAEFLLAYGRSFGRLPLYAQATAGYRYRSGVYALSRRAPCDVAPAEGDEPVCVEADRRIAFSDEWIARAEAGYTVFDRLLVQGLVDVVWSVDSPEPVPVIAGVVQPEGFPEQRLVRLGGGATLRMFGETGFSVQVYTPVYGRNALDATELFVGVETRF